MSSTRFAPTPSGEMHLGHFLNLLCIYSAAQKYKLYTVLRIEDRDLQRCSVENTVSILADLKNLPVLGQFDQIMPSQSKRTQRYQSFTEKLTAQKRLFTCSCSRKDILQKRSIYQDKPTCVSSCRDHKTMEIAGLSLRLNFPEHELLDGLLVRNRDGVYSYEFTSVIDDYDDKITHVVRGRDLVPAEIRLHTLRGTLFAGSPKLIHIYHPLLFESSQQKLSKSRGSLGLRKMIADGWGREDLIGYCAYLLGVQQTIRPQSLAWWLTNGYEKLAQSQAIT